MKAAAVNFRSIRWAAREFGIDEELARELVRVNVEAEKNIRRKRKEEREKTEKAKAEKAEKKKFRAWMEIVGDVDEDENENKSEIADNADNAGLVDVMKSEYVDDDENENEDEDENEDENDGDIIQVKIVPRTQNPPGVGDIYLATVKWWERALGSREYVYDMPPSLELERLIVKWYLEGKSKFDIAYALAELGMTLAQVKRVLGKWRVPTHRGFQPTVDSVRLLSLLWKDKLPKLQRDLLADYVDLGTFELVAERHRKSVDWVKRNMKLAWDLDYIRETAAFDPSILKVLKLGI